MYSCFRNPMQQAIQLRTGKQLKFVYQTQDTKKQGEGNSLDRGICMVMRILLFLGTAGIIRAPEWRKN